MTGSMPALPPRIRSNERNGGGGYDGPRRTLEAILEGERQDMEDWLDTYGDTPDW